MREMDIRWRDGFTETRRYRRTVSALQTLERRTISKISWRLLPLIVIIYFVAYIDRTNVSFE